MGRGGKRDHHQLQRFRVEQCQQPNDEYAIRGLGNGCDECLGCRRWRRDPALWESGVSWALQAAGAGAGMIRLKAIVVVLILIYLGTLAVKEVHQLGAVTSRPAVDTNDGCSSLEDCRAKANELATDLNNRYSLGPNEPVDIEKMREWNREARFEGAVCQMGGTSSECETARALYMEGQLMTAQCMQRLNESGQAPYMDECLRNGDEPSLLRTPPAPTTPPPSWPHDRSAVAESGNAPVSAAPAAEASPPLAASESVTATLSAGTGHAAVYVVQFVATANPDTAHSVAERVRANGADPYIVSEPTTRGPLFRVILGPYPTAGAADSAGRASHDQYSVRSQIP